ncbi:MAG: hypothetical protein F6K07_32775, partial [Okeania sp. SIO1H5]|uniref:hypothetical protein n=1 Tax=Okeania sp. SIO1H5 TaxID=2607777 RepID=UPI0013B665B5
RNFSCWFLQGGALFAFLLSVSGKKFDHQQGVALLRNSAYQGRYLTGLSKLFLTRFLDPYDSQERLEKQKAFRSILTAYPQNPMYLFLYNDDLLAFEPKQFFSEKHKQLLAERIPHLNASTYSNARYHYLVQLQHSLLHPGNDTATNFDLREFAYYPHFLRALRLSRNGNKKEAGSWSHKARRQLKRSKAPQSRKGYLAWHMKDALQHGAP